MDVVDPVSHDGGEHEPQLDMMAERRAPRTTSHRNGVPETCRITTGRETMSLERYEHMDHDNHYVIWDGDHGYWPTAEMREKMTPAYVNVDELRGWWARRNDTVAFSVPIIPVPKIEEEAEDVEMSGPSTRSWVTWKVGIGRRVWRATDYEYYNGKLFDVQWDTLLLGLNSHDKTVDLLERSEHYYGNECMRHTLPIGKFLDQYSPVRTEILQTIGTSFKRTPFRLAASFGPATLWKIRKQWMKVHVKCEERKYAPGGLGHKRARTDFEQRRSGGGHRLARGLAMRGLQLTAELATRAAHAEVVESAE